MRLSPVASLFGISSATIASSPLVSALEPLLIAISAVSFTISYYSLYVLPKYKSSCVISDDCGCAPTDKEARKIKFTKIIFWLGLVISIGILSYVEYQKYQAANVLVECSTSECAPEGCFSDPAPASDCDISCDCETCGNII